MTTDRPRVNFLFSQKRQMSSACRVNGSVAQFPQTSPIKKCFNCISKSIYNCYLMKLKHGLR